MPDDALDCGHVVLVQLGRWVETQIPVFVLTKQAIDDATMEVGVSIERRPETLARIVLATRCRMFSTTERQQDVVDSVMVWYHLFPNRGCVAGNGRVPSTR